MDLYLFKHDRSKTAYLRWVRRPSRIPTGTSKEPWLRSTLLTALSPKTYQYGNKADIYEHLLKFKMLVTNSKESQWKDQWTCELSLKDVKYEDANQAGAEVVKDLIQDGYFVLNRTVAWTLAKEQLKQEPMET